MRVCTATAPFPSLDERRLRHRRLHSLHSLNPPHTAESSSHPRVNLQAGLIQNACQPSRLVQSIQLTRLYMPDRVRRRDLRAQGDAFGLLGDLKKKVKLAIKESERRA